MIIAIKSEMDARVVLYPLMQACSVYGSVLVLTNNKYIRRVIDDQEFSTFKNIAIIVDETGTADEMCQMYNIAPGDYDYTIMDNVSAVSYDKCICLFGEKSSELFADDIETMKQAEDNSSLFFLNYGQTKKAPASVEKSHKKLKKGESELPDDYDPEQKFRDKAVEEKKKEVKEYCDALPSFGMIEKLEGIGQFEAPSDKLCKMFYDMLGETLNIQYNLFRKEIRNTNEGSSSVKSKWPGR